MPYITTSKMSQRPQYTLKDNIYSSCKPDQTVILKKRFLNYLPGIKSHKELNASSPVCYAEIDDEEWHPSVNSYYPFTEDVDAFARVHHLLASRYSTESIKDDDQPLINEYSERKAEQRYLRSKPFCFLILGKPGLGEEDVGRRLAAHWKAVYVDPQTLIEEEVANNSRPGVCIEFNLRCGRAIGIDVLMRLLAQKVQTPEVIHRGFVCSGFPLVPNDLFEEDPISSESAVFNVQEIFDELIDRALHYTNVSDKVAVSMVSSSKFDVESKASEVGSFGEPVSDSIKVSLDWTVETQMCGRSEISTDLQKQLNCIFGLFRDPFMIIYLCARNSDVVTKRSNYYFDFYSKKNIDLQKIKLFYEQGANNEELIDDLFGDGTNPFSDNPNLKHIVRMPENLQANVSAQLARYHREIVNALDCRVLQHEQQCYIKLDARSFISQMMDLIELRLKLLPIQPVITPQEFTSYEQLGEGPEPEQATVREAFLKFCTQDTQGVMFKWHWSDWGPFCPVSMFGGEYQEGSPTHAVHFTNKIYFLSGDTHYRHFMANPRPYLLPPFPKPGSNILVFGPPVCGKSAVTNCLGYLLNSKVLTFNELHSNYLSEVVRDYKERVRQSSISEALQILNRKRSSASEENDARIAQWEAEAVELLARLIEVYEAVTHKVEDVFSSFPMKMEQEASLELHSLDEENLIRDRLVSLNFPSGIDKEYCYELLRSRDALRTHLPDGFKEVVEETAPSPLDPFVAEYADQRVEEIDSEEISKQVNDNIYEMYTRGIKNIEEQSQFDGWIVDGMSTDFGLLEQVCADFHIHEVVILTSDYGYLIDRFRKGDKRAVTYRDFRKFFLRIGERDAAWRAPSNLSTKSYRDDMAEDIISELLDTVFDEETIENERELSTEEYKKALEVYDTNIQPIRSFFETHQPLPLVVDVENLPIEDVLEEVIYLIQDRYRRVATQLTEADRSAEIQQFLAMNFQGGEGETDDRGAGDLFEKYRRYGDTYRYDPVTFSRKFVLRRGKEDFAVKFEDKVYLCANEANMRDFIRWPRKFLFQDNPPERFPPPRICVVGPNHELISAMAKSLARNLGVRYVDFTRVKKEALMLFSTTALLLSSHDDDDMPEAIVDAWYDKLFATMWFEEPLKYIGFTIDSFPVDSYCLDYMLDKQALPDVIVHVTLTREENLKRQLATSLDEWRESVKNEQDEKKLLNSMIVEEWEEQRRTRYKELMEVRRQSRYSDRISQKLVENPVFGSDSQISLDSVVDQQDHDEIVKIVDEEFPEPVFEYDEPSEEAVMEQLTVEIENKYDKTMENLEEMKRICDSALISFVEIDGEEGSEKVFKHLCILGDELKFRGPSPFERCYDVALEMAEKLLTTGYCFLSTFGRLCPVQYYEGYNPLHMYLGSDSRDQIYPVIHRDYIYFVDGKHNRSKFYKNPLKYVTQEDFNFQLIPMRVAVIGPPKSGKSSLVGRFERDLGFKVVSRGQAIRYVLSNPLFTNLVRIVEALLRKGEELSDEIVMECVLAATFCGENLTQGLVFDGFPNTQSEITALSRLGLVPHVVFDLRVDKIELDKHFMNPHYNYPQYSQRFSGHLLEEWSRTQEVFRKWCDREYQNIFALSIDRCIWGVWDKAKELTLAVAFERKHYYKHVKLDWPLRLSYMLVTPLEFLERKSSYNTYCPGCLFHSRRFLNGGEPPDRTGLVHYGKYFYWLCEAHVESFLKNPDKYLPPSNAVLPSELPKVVVLSKEPAQVVEDGYCVVCIKNNFPTKVLMKGTLQHVVFYKGHYYKFDTLEHLTNFMEHPENLSEVTLKFKKSGMDGHSLEYRALPALGMLEQYVAGSVVRAVTHANTYRPVIPGLTISQAALILIGLNLKTNSRKTERPEIYKQALESFHERRLNFLKYLDLMKRYLNPCVHYEEPDTPSLSEIEIDEDEGEFFAKTYSSVR